jgi:Glyoxalase-like domain
MAIGRLSFLTIDANDPERLASFWSAMLGVEVEERMDEGRFVFLGPSNDIVISFQRVPEPKSGKNRVHLDVRIEDLDAATGRPRARRLVGRQRVHARRGSLAHAHRPRGQRVRHLRERR